MLPPPTLTDMPPRVMSEETQWRRRRRREEPTTDEDTRSVVSSQWQPDAADVEMMHSLTMIDSLPVDALRLQGGSARVGRRVKRMKVDLAAMAMASDGGDARSATASLFTPLVEMKSEANELTGSALLCFLSPDTFVGFVELQSEEGQRHVLKLNGSESLTECDRAMCAVQDCCGDKAFLVTAQTAQTAQLAPGCAQPGRRKRSFLARSAGVGDYVAFEGRGIRFVTDFVPGEEQRAQVLKRHFSMLPRAVRHEAVLCLGQMTIHWRGLGAAGESGTGEGVMAAEGVGGGGGAGSSGVHGGQESHLAPVYAAAARAPAPAHAAQLGQMAVSLHASAHHAAQLGQMGPPPRRWAVAMEAEVEPSKGLAVEAGRGIGQPMPHALSQPLPDAPLGALGTARPRGHRSVQRRREEHEGYAGDKSEAGSSGDEHELRSSMRGILPMLSGVAHVVAAAAPQSTPQPNPFTEGPFTEGPFTEGPFTEGPFTTVATTQPNPFTLEELIGRGGTLLQPNGRADEDWLE
jgi:hypothetical protein